MLWRTTAGRGLAAALISVGLLGSAAGCRTTTDDIERWGKTVNGPTKLVAVVTHDKYSMELRTEAAMTLVRMKPRSGTRVGIERLLEALEGLSPSEREKIVAGMVPQLVEGIKQPIPKAQAGGQAPPDPTVPYKDAAFAMLTHDGQPLVSSAEHKDSLRAALAHWALTDFAARLDNSSQMFGMEQVLRELGNQGAKGLPALMVSGEKKIQQMANLVAELGDEKTKEAASKQLVSLAKEVNSEAWIKKKAPLVEAANKRSGHNPKPEQFQKQLAQYQEEELMRVFGSMKKVGGSAVVDYLVSFGADAKNDGKQRAAALAALEGKLDAKDAGQVSQLLKIVGGEDTPDIVRAVALNRVGEMPRKLVAEDLYKLFQSKKWRIRWTAADLLLTMSKAEHVPEFMKRIAGVNEGMSLSEPISYGRAIAKMKADTQALAEKYAGPENSVPERLVALSYWYEAGDKSDLPKVEKYASDRSNVPECLEDAEGCEWKCAVGSGKSKETKDVKTVGDFVSYCIKPKMEANQKAEKKKDQEKKEEKK